MRVAHVSCYFAPAFTYGGPPRSILGLCQGLMAAGVELEVLTTTADGPKELPPRTTAGSFYEGVPVRYFPRVFPKRVFRAEGLREALFQAASRVDLIHLHGLWNVPIWLGAAASRRSRVPFVLSPRGMLDRASMAYHGWRKTMCYNLWEKRNVNAASFLHATSTSEERSLRLMSLVPPIHVVPNGIFLPPTAPEPRWRKRLGLSKSAAFVLYLGRLHPNKRVDLFLEAAAKLRRQHSEVHAVVAGPSDGIDPETLAAASRNRNLHFLGEVSGDDKWALLHEASALVLCSDSESFGMSVIEAMAMHTPVVVTRTCPWEEIERLGCGFWVEQQPDAIASALSRLLADPDRARQMGEQGHALVESRYDWEAVGRDMAARYEGAIGSRG